MLPLAIVLGVDTPIGLTVMRELGEHGVPVHGIGRTTNALGRASRYCTSFSVRPSGRAMSDWLPDVIAETGAAVLFAISEGDLLTLADMPTTINGCRILTPRRDKLDFVLDKRRTLDLAATLGIDVPHSWQPTAEDDFAQRAAALTFPVVVKWADPNAALPLLDAHDLIFEKAEFALDADQLLVILERYRLLGIWPLVQGYCPGQGLGQMLLMSDGHARLHFQHRRLHEWPPEGGVSTLCASEPDDAHMDQMRRSEALLRSIGWEGPAMVEYRHDPATGRYWLMEINGRFWGSLPLAWHCGANFAWTAYGMALADQLPPAPSQGARKRRRARYMIPETRRLLRVLNPAALINDPLFIRRPMADLFAYLLGCLDPATRHYVFSWRDPGPFVSDAAHVVGKGLRLIAARLSRHHRD